MLSLLRNTKLEFHKFVLFNCYDIAALASYQGREKGMNPYKQRFAGKPRTEVSLVHMRQLSERLFEIEGQLTQIQLRARDPDIKRNLTIIRQQLGLYDKEYREVMKAQSAKKAAAPKADPLAGLLRVRKD